MSTTDFQEGPLIRFEIIFGPVLDTEAKPECLEKKPEKASLDWNPNAHRDQESNPGLIRAG